MGRHPAERPIPDLFSNDRVRDASPPQPKPSTPKATPESAPQRHILPKNLRSAVKHLSDGELDLMHAATLEEIKRRGRLPPGVETDLPSLGHRLKRPTSLADETDARKEPLPTRTRGHPRSLADARSGECYSCSLQRWHHANPYCATVWDFPIERAEGVGIRQAEALKAGSGFAAC